jgi:hypothetical protein
VPAPTGPVTTVAPAIVPASAPTRSRRPLRPEPRAGSVRPSRHRESRGPASPSVARPPRAPAEACACFTALVSNSETTELPVAPMRFADRPRGEPAGRRLRHPPGEGGEPPRRPSPRSYAVAWPATRASRHGRACRSARRLSSSRAGRHSVWWPGGCRACSSSRPSSGSWTGAGSTDPAVDDLADVLRPCRPARDGRLPGRSRSRSCLHRLRSRAHPRRSRSRRPSRSEPSRRRSAGQQHHSR